MDKVGANEEGRPGRHTARIIVSMVIMSMLIWIVHTGYKLATKTRRGTEGQGSEDSYIALAFGLATVTFGSVYFVVGLTIVVELALDLVAWLQTGDAGADNNQETEEKTICQIILQTLATMVSMFMLSWAIYHGFKLAVEAPKGATHNCLALIIGFITMGFGFTYFVIGIAMVTESVLLLSSRLDEEVARSDICQDGKKDATFDV